jgi:DNA invertase Pin-like site-specific DNA recombinase
MSAGNSTLRGVAYYRMSTGKQEASIPEQREWAEPTCRREGVQIVKEFSDEAISGSELDRRPGFQTLLSYCEEQAEAGTPLQVVVNWDGDRFSRGDSIRTAACVARLLDAGVTRMLSQEGWTDWEDDTDRVLYNLKQDLSRAGYSKSLAKNVARSMAARALLGLWLGSTPPLGYIVGPDGKLALDPQEWKAALVQRIFHDYAFTTLSAADIARALNREGFLTAKGKKWTRNSVLSTLGNRRYLGESRWADKTQAKYHCCTKDGPRPTADYPGRAGKQRRRKLKHLPVKINAPEDVIVVPGAHPAIIEAETFDRAQRKRAKQFRKRTTPREAGGDYCLSGKLFCGDCGAVMWGVKQVQKQRGKRYVYFRYICSTFRRRGKHACRENGVRQKDLLRAVVREVKDAIATPEALVQVRAEIARQAELLRGAADGACKTLRERLAALDRDIAQGSRNLARLPEDLLPGVIAEVRAWQAQREQVLRDLAALENSPDGELPAERIEEALGVLTALDELVEAAPPAAVREALAPLVEKVTLNYSHRPGGGRNSNMLVSLDIDLTAEFAALLGAPTPPAVMSELLAAGRRR